MFLGTIENTNGKIAEKIQHSRRAATQLNPLRNSLRSVLVQHIGKKYRDALRVIDGIRVDLLSDALESLESGYNLSIISVLGEYYDNSDGETKKTPHCRRQKGSYKAEK